MFTDYKGCAIAYGEYVVFISDSGADKDLDRGDNSPASICIGPTSSRTTTRISSSSTSTGGCVCPASSSSEDCGVGIINCDGATYNNCISGTFLHQKGCRWITTAAATAGWGQTTSQIQSSPPARPSWPTYYSKDICNCCKFGASFVLSYTVDRYGRHTFCRGGRTLATGKCTGAVGPTTKYGMVCAPTPPRGTTFPPPTTAPQTTNFGPPTVWRTSVYLPF